jgi:hypothetical protein
VTFPLRDGSQWEPDPCFLNDLHKLYRGVNVGQELIKMQGWLLANESRRKTRRGMKRFVVGWLNRAMSAPPRPVSDVRCARCNRQGATLSHRGNPYCAACHGIVNTPVAEPVSIGSILARFQ